MKKKIVLVLCGCLLAGSLAGCGGSTESAGNGDSEIKSADEQELGDYEMQELEDTEFTFYQFSVENHDNYQKLIDSYNQIHPNVKINLESIKDEGFVKEIAEEAAVLEKKAIAYEQKILAQANVSKSVIE